MLHVKIAPSGQLLTSFTDDYDELDDLGVHSPTFNYQLDHTCLLIITSNYIHFIYIITKYQIISLYKCSVLSWMGRYVQRYGPFCPEILAVMSLICAVMSMSMVCYVHNYSRCLYTFFSECFT